MIKNFGLYPPFAERMHKKKRKPAMAGRALRDLDAWRQGLTG